MHKEHVVPVKGENAHLRCIRSPRGEADVPLLKQRRRTRSHDAHTVSRQDVTSAMDRGGAIGHHRIQPLRRNESREIVLDKEAKNCPLEGSIVISSRERAEISMCASFPPSGKQHPARVTIGVPASPELNTARRPSALTSQ